MLRPWGRALRPTHRLAHRRRGDVAVTALASGAAPSRRKVVFLGTPDVSGTPCHWGRAIHSDPTVPLAAAGPHAGAGANLAWCSSEHATRMAHGALVHTRQPAGAHGDSRSRHRSSTASSLPHDWRGVCSRRVSHPRARFEQHGGGIACGQLGRWRGGCRSRGTVGGTTGKQHVPGVRHPPPPMTPAPPSPHRRTVVSHPRSWPW